MVVCGYPWLSMVTCGYQWLSVVICGYPWLYIICGYPWLSVVIMVSHGYMQLKSIIVQIFGEKVSQNQV